MNVTKNNVATYEGEGGTAEINCEVTNVKLTLELSVFVNTLFSIRVKSVLLKTQ